MWLQGPGFFRQIVAAASELAESFAEWCVLLLRGDGDPSSTSISDSSLTTRAITLNGQTNIDVSRTRFGTGALEFDGTGDYLTAADSTDWQFGTGDFTVEFWVWHSSVSTDQQIFHYGKNTVASGADSSWGIVLGGVFNPTKLRAYFYNGTTQYALDSTSNLSANTWYHVAYTRASGTTRLFINGVLEASNSHALAPNTPASADLKIGYYDTGASRNLNGFIDELRILKGVAAYTAAFTPLTRRHSEPVDTHYGKVVLLLRGEGSDASTTFTDESPISKGNATVVGNAQIDTAQFKFGTSSMLFDGTGDNIYFADSPSFDLLASNWTMEGWVRFNALPAVDGDHYIWGQYHTATGASSTTVYVAVNRTSGVIRWAPRCNAAVGSITGLTSTPVTGTWYHIAFTRSGSSIRFFVNGVQEGSTLTSAASIPGSIGQFSLGQLGDYNAGYFNGWIDSFRFTVGAARYTAAFTPPLLSFPIQGPEEPDPYYHQTVLQLNCNGVDGSTKFVDTSPVGNSISVFGNAQIDTAQSRFGGASALFDGNGDYITIADSPDLEFGSGDFTVELWIRTNSIATNAYIFGKYGTAGNYGPFLIYRSGSSINFYSSSNGSSWDLANVLTMGTVAVGNWYHLAACRKGSVIYLFNNGALTYSGAFSGTPINNNLSVTIGGIATSYYEGWVDDVRITKGVARYTAAFTPPTREFGTVQGDAHEDSVVLLIKGESDELSSIIKDYSKDNRAITVTSAFVSRYERRFGSGSIDFRGDGTDTGSVAQPALVVPATQTAFGTADFTIEMWVNPRRAPGVYGMLLDCRPAATQGLYPLLYVKPDATFGYFTNSAERITGGYAAINAWTHVAVSRVSGTTRMFVNGVQAGSNYTDANNYLVATNITIGRNAFDTTDYGFDGFMDQIRVTKGVGRYSAAFQPLTRPFPDYSRSNIPDYKLWTPRDAFPEHTVLLLRGNGTEASTTITDESPVARTVTANGNANIDTTRFMFGTGSIEFDGTGDYLTAPDSTDWDFTTGLTIEMWLYVTAFDTNGCMLVSQENAAAAGGFEFAVSATGVLKFNLNDSTTVVQSAASAITTGVWTHVAVSWDGITYRLYKNGRILASTASETAPTNVAGLLRIGNYVTNGDSDLNGYIEDLRILKDIAAYVVDFTPPARTLPSADDPYYGNVATLLRMEGADNGTTFTDESPIAKSITVGGNAKTKTDQFKFGTSSAYFDGTTDYLTWSRTGYEWLTNTLESFTVDCWVRPTTGFANYRCIFMIGHNAASNYGFGINLDITTGKPYAYFAGNGGSFSTTQNLSVSLDVWSHIAVTYNHLTNTISLYVNGILSSTGVKGAGSFSSPAYDPVVGAYTSVNAYALSFLGWIDNFRITRGVIRYAGAFVPAPLSLPVQGPPEPDPYYHLTKLLLNCNGADASTTFTDQSPAARGNATVVGDAQVDTAQSRFGGASLLTDGTGSGLSYANSADFQFGSGDFTIEFWFRVNGWSSNYNTLVNLWASAGGRSYIILVTSGALDFLWSANGTGTDKPSPVRGPSAPTTGVWYHAAFTRHGGTFRTFLNGVSGTPVYDSAAMYAATPSLTIGYTTDAGDTYRHNGWIDDLRITKGAARYTANFIPPTREFGTVQGDAFPEDVVLLLKGEGPDASTAIHDYSKYNRAVTVNGNAQIDTAQFKWGLGSLLFDGTGDYLDFPDSPEFTLGTLDFTVEAWIRLNATGVQHNIAGQMDSGGTAASTSFALYVSAANKLTAYAHSGATILPGGASLVGTTSLASATWYHVALTRSGSAWKLFLDGVVEASGTDSSSINDSSSRFSVGRAGELTSSNFNGWIDDFRFTRGRARYTAAFPALTKEFPEY